MHCAMCGYEFEPSQLTCHRGCPLGAHCMVICCPRCGYSTVDSARAVVTRGLLRLFGKGEGASKHDESSDDSGGQERTTVRLIDMQRGQRGYIAELGGETPAWNYLSRYGLLAGTPVRLLQKRPVPVVQVGETELALEYSVAAEIQVEVGRRT